ncbi:hypothetical protein KPL71_013684 [Citrus sinensis]|uniref:Uncharacterized protein n=1 Tax=Citrus sinensis TaxID=2711 RepID=A0ACB8LM06_CITSI|nr:hypothetical protein KPL71_013684 [Citrus sinensis]
MGVISRKMLPACESFCFFCPELKARSRHPVKWYKKLLAEIFPRSQDEQPNDRKISKLLFARSLFATSLLGIIHILLDQTRYGELRMLGCQTLFEFVINQVWFMGEFSHIPTVFDNPISRRRCGKDDSPTPDSMIRISSWKNVVNEKGELLVGEPKNPKFWPRVCLRNKAKLAKEANTVRAVFESVFHYFDKGDLWSAQHGVAPAKFGIQFHQFSYKLLPLLLLQYFCLMHLVICIHCFFDDSNLGAEVTDWNRKYRSAVDECLVQLSVKIGDASPVSDMMAVMLENVSSITVMTRILISAVYRTAQIAFPEALFHQLLQATVCADHESRIAAHSIFSVVLIPSSVCPHPRATAPFSKKAADQIQRTLSRNLSVFSSLAALFEKLTKEHFSSEENLPQELKDKPVHDENEFAESNTPSMLIRLKSIVYSTKKNPSTGSWAEVLKRHSSTLTEDEGKSRSIPQETQSPDSLMLSSIWAQSICPLNTPQNYKAIAHTYSLVLLFARSKRHCNHHDGDPSLTLSMCMIILSSKAYNIPAPVLSVKTSLVDKTKGQSQSKESIATLIVKFVARSSDVTFIFVILLQCCSLASSGTTIVTFEILLQEDSSGIKQQLLKEFTPADGFPLGAQFFIESCHGFEPSLITTDNDVSLIAFGNQTDPFTLAEETPNLLGVDELLDSVSNKTPQVGRSSVSTPSNMPYNEMAGNCEALLMGKHQKMSVSMSSQAYQSSVSISAPDYMNATYNRTPSSPNDACYLKLSNENNGAVLQIQSANSHSMPLPTDHQQQPHFFQLPPSNPYDHFLKAAGC